ncbi:hypothetical protein SDRG_04404 [Saprolegnia diclina VS20]|uniref:FHA domain-containing protein n=1 Tax=Saprolegnia diclina (strain VS20) TaxID=1156394 RepID=T0QJ20_SAPDV|nr:hypothetical protein SDRG_04404 [Saprolegnia diclina VS20]EQC37974.1 hypothetical protein SDRG_04404 [Saprolegnia diclina VS20]|eukprot:XP_008608301.1 hypothetical protein SDRG_04404 [Saprolegnia diclina VS20]
MCKRYFLPDEMRSSTAVAASAPSPPRPAAPSLLLKTSAMQSALFEPSAKGITIGSGASNRFCIASDASVDLHHATLEHTAVHGIWVYVDHSRHGSYDRDACHVHRSAAIVGDGDTFMLGATQVQIHFYTSVPSTSQQSHHGLQHLVTAPSRAIAPPDYTNSPLPKHKRAQHRPTEFSFDPLHFQKLHATSVPLEYAASPPVANRLHVGPTAATKPAPSKRDDLRILVSKKMANLNPKPSVLHASPTTPPHLVAGHHHQIPLPRKTMPTFALDIEPLRSATPSTSTRVSSSMYDDDGMDDDVFSSVDSSAPTEVAKYRDSLESLGSDNQSSRSSSDEDDAMAPRSNDHYTPNIPPRRVIDGDDLETQHRLIASLRLKRVQPKIQTSPQALLSPYKTAKSLRHDPLQFYMESPREASSYFDYKEH